MTELEEIVEQQQYQIDKLYNVIADKQRKNKERRIKEYEKNQFKEHDPFVKSYPNEGMSLFDLKEQKKLSNADMGRIWELSQFLEPDTSLLVNPNNGYPLNKTNMCKFIREPRQHFDKDLQRLIDLDIVIVRKDNANKDIFFMNNKYVFNGFSRAKVSYTINNVFVNNGTIEGNVIQNVTSGDNPVTARA